MSHFFDEEDGFHPKRSVSFCAFFYAPFLQFGKRRELGFYSPGRPKAVVRMRIAMNALHRLRRRFAFGNFLVFARSFARRGTDCNDGPIESSAPNVN